MPAFLLSACPVFLHWAGSSCESRLSHISATKKPWGAQDQNVLGRLRTCVLIPLTLLSNR
jgi:hypothetical protein